MNLSSLLNKLSRVSTKMGTRNEILRLAPRSVEPEFRKVVIRYAQVTVKRTYLLPWVKPEVVESWDITAEIELRDGTLYTVTKLVRLDFNRASELVMLEAVRLATLAKIQQVEDRLFG